ncbi:ABC transporter substrate-binding protein [Helcobacillus massiliensis]|uniref:siderophore ABC transporter substrate-binding protein n=1 Tax=Helcobacillus TaxID=1161125 RepID=UPI001EF5D2B1|nr:MULTISPECIES: ABC transporter substrate-binding protein [Helcobacillus]MCG7427186.1 ABC transporter substrate-binding protein [Helcobacillus sp. ACRRO]MCT1556792.1 ABC transporter substrate-binding protein [Helcobacillus massiliensis]MCT2035616.1 ABC transporter substrate-binding protein [Helcobacillus massiliensis]MCT2330932.1 ABC transporter substrate-binding protein [Helcobacillus massiliensis]
MTDFRIRATAFSRRSVLRTGLAGAAAAAVTATLAACGSSSADSGKSDSGKSGSASGGTVEVTTARGKATAPKNPGKVAVLDISLVDTMVELGLTDSIVAVPKKNLPERLKSQFSSDKIVDTGALKEPDFDSIAQAGPDLIMIAGRSAGLYDQLTPISKNVLDFTVDPKDFLKSFTTTTEQIGAVFGKEKEAKKKIEEIDARVEDIRKKAEKLDGTTAILMVSGGKVSTYAPGSRFGGIIYDALGFKPMVESTKDAAHGDTISFEFIAEKNPARAFVVDRDAAIGDEGKGAKAVLDNDVVKRADAFKNDSVVYVDSHAWYISSTGIASLNSILDDAEKGLAAAK